MGGFSCVGFFESLKVSAPPPDVIKVLMASVSSALAVALITWAAMLPAQIQKIEDFKVAVDARVAAVEKRQEAYLTSQQSIQIELARLSSAVDHIRTDAAEIKRDMKSLTYKPSLIRNKDTDQ